MRRKDFPKEILIGDSLWQIRFKKTIAEGKDTLGLCDPSEHTIYIKQGLGFEERLNVFFHECLHAISYEGGFYSIDHKVIYDFADGLSKIFTDNVIKIGCSRNPCG